MPVSFFDSSVVPGDGDSAISNATPGCLLKADNLVAGYSATLVTAVAASSPTARISQRIPPAYATGTVDAFLVLVNLGKTSATNTVVRTSTDVAGSGSEAGPDFTVAGESGIGIAIRNDQNPSFPTKFLISDLSDTTEPYEGGITLPNIGIAFTSGTVDVVVVDTSDANVDWDNLQFTSATPVTPLAITGSATVSLFDAAAQNPGATGDIGVRFNHTFDAFTGLSDTGFARLIEEGTDSDGLTHTFQDTAGTTQTLRFIILRIGGASVRVLVNAGNLIDATEQAYHIALRGSGDIWDLAFSTDVSGTSPYDMPLAGTEVQKIRDVIDVDGNDLDVIIFDSTIADDQPGWSAANLTYTSTGPISLAGAGGSLAGALSLGTTVTPVAVSGSLSGAGGTLTGALSLGTDTPRAISGSLSGAGGILSSSLSLFTVALAVSGSLAGAGGALAGSLNLGTVAITPRAITGSLSGAGGDQSGNVRLGVPLSGSLNGTGGALAGSLTLQADTVLSVSGSLAGAGGELAGLLRRGPTLFDDPEHNPGADGDVGVRWANGFDAFESTGTGVFRLILGDMDADGSVHAFQDRSGAATQFQSLVIRTTAQQLLVNLDRSITAASVAAYRIAFRGGSDVWDFAFSADSDGLDPYVLPGTTADLQAITDVITDGGTLEAIVFDVSVADDLPGWDAATLAHDRIRDVLEVSGALAGTGGNLAGSLTTGTDTPLSISGTLSGVGGTLVGSLGLASDTVLAISGSVAGDGGTLVGRIVSTLPIAGTLVGAGGSLTGGLTLGSDVALAISGTLAGSGGTLMGSLSTTADTPLALSGSLTGAGGQLAGSVTRGVKTAVPITGLLRGDGGQLRGRITRVSPLGMPTGLRSVRSTLNSITVAFTPVHPVMDGQPILRYEASLDGGAWRYTEQEVVDEVLIDRLDPGTSYSVRLRAVDADGAGPASAAIVVGTVAVVPPSAPIFARVEPAADGMGFDLVWEPPLNDGGAEITSYEAFICDEAGQNCGWETIWKR